MGKLVDELGSKIAGQLVKSEDWNALVKHVEVMSGTLTQTISDLSASVTTQFQAVNSNIHDLDVRVDQLETDFFAFQETFQPFLQEYYRLTMETSKVNYSLGEVAEITARVTDLQGNPFNLSDASSRPWVDFVAVWGILRPASGFSSREGAVGRAISVRTNSEGIAKVRLTAEHAEGITEEAEDEVAGFMEMEVQGTNVSVAQIITQAAVPMEVMNAGVFSMMTTAYETSEAASLPQYVDTYYQFYPQPQETYWGWSPAYWRHYRSTVMALAKKDSDPKTPDQSRAVSSIQVDFRDWIGPWLAMEFLAEIVQVAQQYQAQFASNVTSDFAETMTAFQQNVAQNVSNKGVLGKQRAYQAMRYALDHLVVEDSPPFLNDIRDAMQGAIGMQAALESAKAVKNTVAVKVFTDTATQAQSARFAFEEEVSKLSADIDSMGCQVQDVQNSLGVLDERTNNVQTASAHIKTDVQTLRNQVTSFESLNVKDVQEAMGKANVLWKDRVGDG